MCGIAGFAGQLAVGHPDRVRSLLRSATDVLAHRGPDGDGGWLGETAPVALGHRRLAIIDLSDAASQPMVSSHPGRAITFNGEIYNYRELREDLSGTGHVFKTHSDTEVLLAACEVWGPARAAERMRGMFAFAYVDITAGEMWLARDRFGEKPVYWATWNGSFAFGSELKALRTLPHFPHAIDRSSLDHFLRYQAMSAPRTIYSNVYQVSPGALLRVALSDRISASDVTEHVYWDAVEEAGRARSTPFRGSFSDAADRLDEVLGASVSASMVSDVPLGAFLSGGIDSSTIVALMCRYSSGPVKTFTIGFDEDHMSEAEQARKVAAHLGVDHTELMVTAQQALDVIPRLAEMYDEPFADSSQIPTHLVSAMTREHVTVSLSGDAGDELFGGYNRYFLAGELWSKVSRVPRPIRRMAGRGILGIPIAAWDRVGSTIDFGPMRKFSGRLGDRAHKMAGVLGAVDEAELYSQLVTHWDGGIVIGAAPPTRSPLPSGFSFTEQMMLRDTVEYLPDDILVKVDRAAMATSLETRVPMLDPDVYRFAWSLPLDFKARAGRGKLVLRELLSRYVPPHLVERPKMGFGVPLDEWLRGPLKSWGDDLLNPAVIKSQGFLDAELVRRHWDEHQSGSRNWHYKLWGVLMFQAWHERWG